MSLFHEAMQGGTTVASRSEHVQGAVYRVIRDVAEGNDTTESLAGLCEQMVSWCQGHIGSPGDRLADVAAALEDLKI